MDPIPQGEIPNHWTGPCFGCSPMNRHGLQLRFWYSEKGCLTKFSIPEHLCGFAGLAHGGIIATIVDEVAAWAIIARLARLGITQEMAIRYIKAVPTHQELLAEGQIISQQAEKALVQTKIFNSKGGLLAEGESTWVFPSLAVIARLAGVSESILDQFLAHYAPQGNEPYRPKTDRLDSQ